MEPRNRFQGTNSASQCSLAGRYSNPIPTWFLVPIDCLKYQHGAGTLEQSKGARKRAEIGLLYRARICKPKFLNKQTSIRFDLSVVWNKQRSLRFDLSYIWNKQRSLRFDLCKFLNKQSSLCFDL